MVRNSNSGDNSQFDASSPYPNGNGNGNGGRNGLPAVVNPIVIGATVDSDDDEELSLQQLWAVLRRRAWILAGVTAISAAGMTALVMTQPPSYAGSFRLLVEPVTQGSRIADSLTSDTLQTLGPLKQGLDKSGLDYISQMEVLKSETLLEPVLGRIQQQYPELDFKKFTKQLKVTRPKDSKILDISYEGKDPAQIKFVLNELSKTFIEYSLVDRQTNLKRGIDFVADQIQRQKQDVSQLEIALEEFRRSNNVVDPKILAESLGERVKAIAAEQQSNRIQLAAAQTLYGKLQGQLGLPPNAAIEATTLSEAPIYQDLLKQLREVDSKIAIESARFTAATPVIQTLKDQRAQLMPLLAEEANRVFGGNITASQTAQQSTFQGSVGRELTKQFVEVANRVQVLRTQDQALLGAIAELNQNTQNLAGVSRQYGQIQRDLEIATASLARLLTARENLQLELTRQVNPWELISKIDDRNILPKSNKLLLLLLGALASLIVGIAAALLVEQFDRVYHTIEELKEVNLPCLGTIPYNATLSQEASLKNVGRLADQTAELKLSRRARRDHLTFLEAFYSLDANIRLLSSDHPIRSITISSTTPSDGKSTIACHLAWAAVTMGRRVLIVDTDMRRPQVHSWFGVQNLRGLSNAITSDVGVIEFIQESPQDSNLHILTAGPTPPAPGRLLASNRMRQFAEQLSKQYDLVIFDAPPVLGFADAKLTAANTDGLLLVVGMAKTDRGNLAQALDELNRAANAPVLGLVANGVKNHASSHYHYYNRYYADRPSDEKLKLPVKK
jgi:polysaccharide biosynthesis transport protein